MRRLIAKGIIREPGGESLAHFTPDYNPRDQRLCLVSDSDLFRAIRKGEASVVTDHIVTLFVSLTKESVLVITDAASGIGRALAVRFAQE